MRLAEGARGAAVVGDLSQCWVIFRLVNPGHNERVKVTFLSQASAKHRERDILSELWPVIRLLLLQCPPDMTYEHLQTLSH